MTRFLRVVYLVFATTVLGLVLATPAHAVLGIDDCKDAPAVTAPGGGASGFFQRSGPTPADPAGGAWANGAPIYANYGTAGVTFNNYDLGCGPDAARDFDAVIGTTVGNWVFEVSKFGVAATGGLLHAAYNPDYMSVFDPMLLNGTDALRAAIYDQWAPVAVAIIGVMLLWSTRKAQWASTMLAVGWALLVIVAVTAVVAWPVQAGSAADETAGNVLGAVNNGINGTPGVDAADAAMGTVANAVLFEQWKMGTFGRANSETAEKYARPIFTGQALTYAEADLVRSDPDGAGQDLLDAKADQWEDAAAEIAESDPDAYQYLTGHRGEGRIAAAIVALVAAVCTLPFLVVSALIMIGSFIVIRVAVVLFPAIATIGVVYALRGAVKGIAAVVAAAVINSVIFGIGAAVTILAARILLTPRTGLPMWLAVILMGVFSAIMWIALKPARKLTAIASPSKLIGSAPGAIGDTLGSAKDSTLGFAKMAAAAYTGNAAALATVGGQDDEKQPRAEAFTQPDPAPAAPTAPVPAAPPVTLGSTRDQEPIVATAAPAPLGLPAGTPTAEPAPETSETAGTYRPADDAPQTPDPSLPVVSEPTIDPDTGDEVYALFVPDDQDSTR